MVPEEDELRPKSWWHVSLAYGVDDVDPYRAPAVELVDPTLPGTWQVGLWHRHGDGTWERLC